jgi:hypothetical protein|tara:strand:+ start:185 stop:598 length:414 start_codon:yes stop_codon:yes gene_type:complete
MAKRGPKGPLTEDHKAALALGREESRTVRAYLDGLRAQRPRRGRKRSPEFVQKRLGAIESEVLDADPIKELRLIQERRDLAAALESLATQSDLSELEAAFLKIASSYGSRNGISYGAWREIGVEASVLSQAGISRSS